MQIKSKRVYQAVLLSVVGALSFGACGESNTSGTESSESAAEGVGQVGLQLTLPDGSEVNEVSWVLSRAGQTVTQGTSAVPANGVVTVSIQARAGSGYSLAMSGVRTNGGAACTGRSSDFTVVARQTVSVSVYMQCGKRGMNGTINAQGQFNFCPDEPTIVASPATAAVGQTIALSASAVDADNGNVSFAWSAQSGSFSAANGAAVTYTCSAEGTVAIVVTAEDDQGCSGASADRYSNTMNVVCTPAATPVDAGAPEVDASTPVVDASTPVVDAGAPEVDASTPVVDAGTPVVDAGPPPVQHFPLTAACASCIAPCNTFGDDALPLLDACYGPNVPAADRDACLAVLECQHRNNVGLTGFPEDGYCGTSPYASCFTPTGGANGVCKAQWEAATKSTDPETVGGRLAAMIYPSGPAANLMVCEVMLNCSDVCRQGF